MAFFRSYSTTSLLTVPNLIVVLTAVSLAFVAVQSQYHGRGVGTAAIDDYEETEDPLDPVWTPPSRINCNAEIRERCCHLIAHSTREGSIRVSKAGCPNKYIMQCCPGLRARVRADSPLNVTLSDVIKCIQDLIENLLEFKFTLIGKDRNLGCCKVPLLKNACSK